MSVMNNTLPLPTINGLTRHKSDEWGRRCPPRPCECCPYGYHIDLDFVRFCETLSQADPAGKQRRRERRRQRKSMEVLLGLNSPPSWSSDRDVPQFLNEPLKGGRILESEEDKFHADSPERDELQKAVLDFEDTLQRSQNSTLKRVSDIPTVGSTFYLPPPEVQDLENGNNASGLSAAALQNIREQMAQSLQRMKELEEQVKEIPVLQIQLSLLKDEKRNLLEKLKLNENKRNNSSEQINLNNNNSNKYYTFPLKSGLEMKIPYNETVPLPKRPSLRDVSVSCVTMTRDVGVNHTECPVGTRTVGVNCVASPVETRDIGIQGLTFTELDVPNNNIIIPKEMVSLKTIIKKPSLKDSSTVTDLLFSQLYSDIELDANINKAIKMFEKTYFHKIQKSKCENSVSVGIQVTPPTETLKIVEKNEKAVQAVEKKHVRSYGMNCVPEKCDVQVSFHPNTCDIGVSDDTLDVSCDRCTNKSNALHAITDKQNILSLANLTVTRSKSFDYSHHAPAIKKPRTRSVACGPMLRLTGTKSCDTSDLLGRSKDMGVNTVKRKLVDSAVGDSVLRTTSVNVCDKCSNTIKSVATNILSQSRGELNSSVTTVSRIPRPTTLGNQIFNQDKPQLMRQDTYTKTFSATPTQTLQLSRLKDNYFSKSHNLRGEGRGSSDDGSDDGNVDEPNLTNDHSLFDSPLFQPIHSESRKKCEPSKEMRAAMKVLNDALLKSPAGNLLPQMKNAINIIQQEWFKISSTASANPLDVEDYLDCLEEISSRLLEYVVNMTDVSGNTAMHYAVSHGNFDVVSILLDSKVCNINQTNAAGYTCIMLVSLAQVRSETHRQVIKRLFQQADVNIRAKQHGQTALMLAVSHGRLDMVELLLQTGADVNIQDEDGSTALMCAAEHHHIDIVKLLLAQPDCDLSIRDYDGSTALNIAMEAGNRDIGVLLYAQEHFSRGSSPHTSLRHKRAKSTTPTLRTPTSPQPYTKPDHSF